MALDIFNPKGPYWHLLRYLSGEASPFVRPYFTPDAAYKYLMRVTGQDFGLDVKKWRDWLASHPYPSSWTAAEISKHEEVVRLKEEALWDMTKRGYQEVKALIEATIEAGYLSEDERSYYRERFQEMDAKLIAGELPDSDEEDSDEEDSDEEDSDEEDSDEEDSDEPR